MDNPSEARHLAHQIIDLLAEELRPLHAAEIFTRLSLRDRAALSEALEDLAYEGVIVARAGQRYRLAPGARIDRDQRLEGIIHINPRGFGFVKLVGALDDLFVPAEGVAGAMHSDRVVARVVAHSRRGREGEVVDVVERGKTRVVGVLRGRARQRWLEPDDGRVRGPIEIRDEAPELGLAPRAGLAAAVDITRYPDRCDENPQGRLAGVLGEPGEPDVEIAKVLIEHNIEEELPEAAELEASAFGDSPDAGELEAREDLTDVPFVTIDPHDARDHDDAVWVERNDEGSYQAWIAIADVSHYVTPNSALDACALQRGCSVYLPDRAVPMLPGALSSVLCSLLPDVERLCLCVRVKCDATGAIRKTEVFEGKIRSRAFLSYRAVARALGFTSEPARDPKAEAIRHELRVLWDLASQLRKRRMRRGALDLDVPEARVEIDESSRAPVAVSQRSHDPGVRKAYRLVEELMLLANEAVARLALKRELPMIFRVHAAPDMEKLERYATVCSALGVEFDPEDGADPKRLSKFLRKVAAHPRKAVVHNMLLRSLQQACYDPANIGHFGLASSAYLHFTSPIRRYPDLVVHRLVRAHLRGEARKAGQTASHDLAEAALTASQRERNAMEAERQVADVYRALYMLSRVGELFEATVVALTVTGVYVRIEEPFVDVLVSLDALGGDHYEVDEAAVRAIGTRSGDTVELGDEVTIVIEDVAVLRRTVYGRRIVEATETKRPTRKQRKTQRQQRTKAVRSSRKTRGRGRKRG